MKLAKGWPEKRHDACGIQKRDTGSGDYVPLSPAGGGRAIVGVRQRPGAARHAGGLDVQGRLLRKLDPMRLVKRKESALARLRPVRQRGGQIETWAVVHSARPTPSESSTPSVFPGTFRAAWYP
jgi:hypothetical protein